MPHPLPFTGPGLLAPMEGVTESSFRDLVLRRNGPGFLGGAFTEFVRVGQTPSSQRTLKRHLGPERHAAPVGLQLMGSDLAALAESARRAASAGAPLIDLNFGCPAKGALRGCAGSALLDHPERIEALVRACVQLLGTTPLSAKLRAGGADDQRLEELCIAAEEGGASLISMHCRTRAEGYRDCADWERLARASACVRIPVAGNGGLEGHDDLLRMREQTGCQYAMVGRAALRDPWIFSGHQASKKEAVVFFEEYAELLKTRHDAPKPKLAGRLKQLIRIWSAGSLFPEQRGAWLRQADPGDLLTSLTARVHAKRDSPEHTSIQDSDC